jgi:hypothetical protein
VPELVQGPAAAGRGEYLGGSPVGQPGPAGSGVEVMTQTTNIAAALRHHTRRSDRPLQTIVTYYGTLPKPGPTVNLPGRRLR